MLVLLQREDVIDLQVKPFETFGLVLACFKLLIDGVSKQLLDGFLDLGTLIRRAGYRLDKIGFISSNSSIALVVLPLLSIPLR